jgi:hypothetical protein
MARLRSQEMWMRTPLRLFGIGVTALAALVAVPVNASAASAPSHPAPFVSAPAARPAAGVSPFNVNTTIQGASRLRTGPSTHGTRVVATTTTTDSTSVVCYTRGERDTAGGYTTDVWYFLAIVLDPTFTAGNVWSWGGNVNTQGGVDPDPRVSHC